MRTEWRLRTAMGEVRLAPWHACGPEDRLSLGCSSELPFFAVDASDDLLRYQLIEICQDLGAFGSSFQNTSTQELWRAVGHAVRSGRLVVLGRQRSRGRGELGLPPVAPEPPSAPQPPIAAPETSWITVQLVDQAGVPIAGQRYLVVMPDGRQVSGTLDAMGCAHLENAPPGNCKVSFPDLDGKLVSPA